MHHDGIQETLSAVRETHWIPSSKGLFRDVLCIEDWKESPDLLPERVSEGSPFATTGVNFAGPLYVKSQVTTRGVGRCL